MIGLVLNPNYILTCQSILQEDKSGAGNKILSIVLILMKVVWINNYNISIKYKLKTFWFLSIKLI